MRIVLKTCLSLVNLFANLASHSQRDFCANEFAFLSDLICQISKNIEEIFFF